MLLTIHAYFGHKCQIQVARLPSSLPINAEYLDKTIKNGIGDFPTHYCLHDNTL